MVHVDKLVGELGSVREQLERLLSADASSDDWRGKLAELQGQVNASLAALRDAGYCQSIPEADLKDESQVVQRLIEACEKSVASVETERSGDGPQSTPGMATGMTFGPATGPVQGPGSGRKKARWTPLEKDIQKLEEKRMSTDKILRLLLPKYPDLTWEKVRSFCNRNSKRVKRRKGPR